MSAANPWYSNPTTGLAGVNPLSGLSQLQAQNNAPVTVQGPNGPMTLTPSQSGMANMGMGTYQTANGQVVSGIDPSQYGLAPGQYVEGQFQTPAEGGTKVSQNVIYRMGPNGTAIPVSDTNSDPGSTAMNLGRGAGYIGAVAGAALGGEALLGAGGTGAGGAAVPGEGSAIDAAAPSATSAVSGGAPSYLPEAATGTGDAAAGATDAVTASTMPSATTTAAAGAAGAAGDSALNTLKTLGQIGAAAATIGKIINPGSTQTTAPATVAQTASSPSTQGALGQAAARYSYQPTTLAPGQLPTGGTADPTKASSIINFNDPSASMFGYGVKPIYYTQPAMTAQPVAQSPQSQASGGRVGFDSGGSVDPAEFAAMDYVAQPPAATVAPVAGSDAAPNPADAPTPSVAPAYLPVATSGGSYANDTSPNSHSATRQMLDNVGLGDWWDKYTNTPGTTPQELAKAQKQTELGIGGLTALAYLLRGRSSPPTSAQLAGTLKQNAGMSAAQTAVMDKYFGTPAARYTYTTPPTVRVGGSGLDALAVKAGSPTTAAFSPDNGVVTAGGTPLAGMATGGQVPQFANPYLKVSLPNPASAAQASSPQAQALQQMQMQQFSRPAGIQANPQAAIQNEQMQQYLQSGTTPTGNYAGGGQVMPAHADWQFPTGQDPQKAPEFDPSMHGPYVAPGFHGNDKGQADTVPAMLSHGEYVVDADAVAALGDGNNAAGAKALDNMRAALREHKRSAPPNQIPPKALSPLQYLNQGK